MNRIGAVLFTAILAAALALPQGSLAADEDIQNKVDALSKEVRSLQQQVAQAKNKKSISDWLTIGGDYRFPGRLPVRQGSKLLRFREYRRLADGRHGRGSP